MTKQVAFTAQWVIDSQLNNAHYRPASWNVLRATSPEGTPADQVIPALNGYNDLIEVDDATLALMEADPLVVVIYAEDI